MQVLRLLLPALVCAGCLFGGARAYASRAATMTFDWFAGGTPFMNIGADSMTTGSGCVLTVAECYSPGATGLSIGLSGSSERIIHANRGSFTGNRYGSTSYTWSAPASSGSNVVFRGICCSSRSSCTKAEATASIMNTAAPDQVATPTATASTDTPGKITLSWSAPASNCASITDYVISKSTTSSSAGFSSEADTSTATTYEATGLGNGEQVWFKVSATNSVGTGDESIVVTATTMDVPGAPSGTVTGVAGPEQVVLSWSAPLSDGGGTITGYKIEQSITSDSTGFSDAVANTGDATTTKTITGLENGQQYWFRVYAINSAGTGSSYSTVATATPAAAGVQVNGGIATIAKSFAFGAGAMTSNVALTAFGADPINTVSINPLSSNLTLCTVAAGTDLPTGAGSASNFSLTTTGLAGTCTITFSASSNDTSFDNVSIDQLDVTIKTSPSAPQSVAAANAGSQKVVLSWSAPTSDGGDTITGYKIEQSITSDSTGFSDAVANTGDATTTKTITGLDNGQQYWFRVSAINSVEAGAVSDGSASATVCAPTLVWSPAGGSPTLFAGATASVVAGTLSLGCPATAGSTVKVTAVEVAAAGGETCAISNHSQPAGYFSLAAPSYAANVSVTGTRAGACAFNFTASSSDDSTGYNALTLSHQSGPTVEARSLALSASTLAATFGLCSGSGSSGAADTTITLTPSIAPSAADVT